MRRLPARPALPAATTRRLKSETGAITRAPSPPVEAARRYKNARSATWFAPVPRALGKMAGSGGPCFFCDASEASQVEHYRPKSGFPLLTFTWKNLLWSCAICNQAKRETFPLDEKGKPLLLDPTACDPWSHFFIDDYGNLVPVWDGNAGALESAADKTRTLLKLNRQTLQERRAWRLRQLRVETEAAIQAFDAGNISPHDLAALIAEWKAAPLQPDVADYFLSGPGAKENPFARLLALAG